MELAVLSIGYMLWSALKYAIPAALVSAVGITAWRWWRKRRAETVEPAHGP